MIDCQFYSPSTGETLTLWEDPCQNPTIDEQIAWVKAHPDSVLVYSAGEA